MRQLINRLMVLLLSLLGLLVGAVDNRAHFLVGHANNKLTIVSRVVSSVDHSIALGCLEELGHAAQSSHQ